MNIYYCLRGNLQMFNRLLSTWVIAVWFLFEVNIGMNNKAFNVNVALMLNYRTTQRKTQGTTVFTNAQISKSLSWYLNSYLNCLTNTALKEVLTPCAFLTSLVV